MFGDSMKTIKKIYVKPKLKIHGNLKKITNKIPNGEADGVWDPST